MATWVLILSLVGESQTGKAIESVPGFATKYQCEVAGKEWVRAQYNDNYNKAYFSCSMQGGVEK